MPAVASLVSDSPTRVMTQGEALSYMYLSTVGNHQVTSLPLPSHGKYGRSHPYSLSWLSVPTAGLPLANNLDTQLLHLGQGWRLGEGNLEFTGNGWCPCFAARPGFMGLSQQ